MLFVFDEKMAVLENIPTIQILEELKRRYNTLTQQPEKRVLFIGAPGSGKGTQSNTLQKSHSLCHLATGDMLREAVHLNTPLGVMAKEKMNKGELVDDELVLALIKQKIESTECRRGFILDGFPRNIRQSYMLNDLLQSTNQKLDKVFSFEIPDSQLTERITGRRVHTPSGRVYHQKFNPPKVEGIDDLSGEPLTHRADDNVKTFKKRLETFHKETIPVIDLYSKTGLLYRLDASQSSDEVSTDLYKNL